MILNENLTNIPANNAANVFGSYADFLPDDIPILDDGREYPQTNPQTNPQTAETDSAETAFSWFLKNLGVFTIAGVVFTVGLYWMLASTKTGKKAINIAVTAASKGKVNNVTDSSETSETSETSVSEGE